MTALTPHETRIVDDLIGVIDYASRVLVAASPGSHYQLDKARDLRDRVDRLIQRLETGGTLDMRRSAAVAAHLAPEARRYTLGRVLLDAGHLSGLA